MKKILLLSCLLLAQTFAFAAGQPIKDNSTNFMNDVQIISPRGTFNVHTRYQNWNGNVTLVNKSEAIVKTYCSSADCDAFVRVELNSHTYCVLHFGSDPTFRNIVEVLENGQHGLHCKVKTKKQTNSGPFSLYDSNVSYTVVK